MTRVYEILAYVGWAWMLLCLVVIPIRVLTLRRRERQRGFDVGALPQADKSG